MTAPIVLRRRRGSWPWLILPMASLLILCLGWSALWLFTSREAAVAMDGWLAGEAKRGRVWSCPHREIGGFPLSIEVSCAQPTFAGRVGGETLEGSWAGLRATAALYQPNAVEIAADGPLELHRPDGQNATLSWAALAVGVRLLPGDRARASIEIDAPELQGPAPWTGHAERFELRLGPATGRAAAEYAYDVWLTLANGAIPALDTLTGTADGVSVDEKGVLTHVDPPWGAPWQGAAEAWRQAGGLLDVGSLSVAKGGLRIGAQGQLGVDEAHRLAGELQASLSGVEDLAARLGVPLRAVKVGGVLASLLNPKGKATPNLDQDGSHISLPVVFGDGRVSVGPFRTALRLEPLY